MRPDYSVIKAVGASHHIIKIFRAKFLDQIIYLSKNCRYNWWPGQCVIETTRDWYLWRSFGWARRGYGFGDWTTESPGRYLAWFLTVVTVVNEDILKVDLAQYIQNFKILICYNQGSSQLTLVTLRRLSSCNFDYIPFSDGGHDAKEVADRISAQPNTKAWRCLLIAVQYYMTGQGCSSKPRTVLCQRQTWTQLSLKWHVAQNLR